MNDGTIIGTEYLRRIQFRLQRRTFFLVPTSPAPASDGTKFNWGVSCTTKQNKGGLGHIFCVMDAAFHNAFRTLVKQTAHDIGSTDIIVAGYSMGGFGALQMGSFSPDIYKSLIVVAGYGLGSREPLSSGFGGPQPYSSQVFDTFIREHVPNLVQIPAVFVLHAEPDRLSSYIDAQEIAEAIQSSGGNAIFRRIPDEVANSDPGKRKAKNGHRYFNYSLLDDSSEDLLYARLRTTVPAKWAANGAIKPAQFSVFGLPRLSRHPAQEPCPRCTTPPNTEAHVPSHRSVWDDPEAPSTAIDARPPGGFSTTQPNVLFLVGDSPFDVAWASITSMRKTSYFTPPGLGYQWATGNGPRSAGRRVRARFEHDGNSRTPVLSALEEVQCYTDKRSMPTPVAHDESDMSAFIIRRSFPSGSLFKVAVRAPAVNSLRSWHGTNLYCAYSIFVLGLLANMPNHGPDGIYSFSDKHINKIPFYCDYVLSGTGRAWTVVIETEIADTYETISNIQRCTQAQGTSVVAIWIHGLHHADFSNERIWPRWRPELEVPPVRTRI